MNFLHFFKTNFIITIIFIASFLRLYQLDIVPPSLTPDEATLGYNAFSILKTGRDEYGYKLPLILRAYDDWRPALDTYITIPFVAVLGLTSLAVRLPVFIFSILTILAIYFIAREIFKNYFVEVDVGKRKLKFHLATLAALLLAISPWHIFISRLGHQVNEGLAFAAFGFLFFLKKRIYLSFIFFALSFMSYHPEKIFIPIIVASLIILYRNELTKIKKKVFLAAILGLIIVTPFLIATFSTNGLTRFSATNVLTASEGHFYDRSILLAKAVEQNDFIGQILNNRRVVALGLLLEGYFSHFNPRWLFSNITSVDYHKVPSLGLFYFWEAPLIVIGFIALFLSSIEKRLKIILITWILVSPITAAITTDAPHAVRSFTMLPVFTLISALGFVFLTKKLKHSLSFSLILLGLLAFSFNNFYHNYFTILPKVQSESFQYALSKAIPYVLEQEKKYDKIVFSNQDQLLFSYMFFLFHSEFDPKTYQKQGGTVSGGYAETHKIGKLLFQPIAIQRKDGSIESRLIKEDGRILYIGNVWEFNDNFKEIATFKNLNGKLAIKVVERVE